MLRPHGAHEETASPSEGVSLSIRAMTVRKQVWFFATVSGCPCIFVAKCMVMDERIPYCCLCSPVVVQVQCDAPNNKLEKFDGTLFLQGGEPASLSNENVVLRGCRIRNTKFVHGLVVYAGRDTKLMRNSGACQLRVSVSLVASGALVSLVSCRCLLSLLCRVLLSLSRERVCVSLSLLSLAGVSCLIRFVSYYLFRERGGDSSVCFWCSRVSCLLPLLLPALVS